MKTMNKQLPKEEKLSEVELTPEQRKRSLELFRSTDGVFHDLAIACQNIICLRDQLDEALEKNIQLSTSNIDLRAEVKRLAEYEWMYKDLCK